MKKISLAIISALILTACGGAATTSNTSSHSNSISALPTETPAPKAAKVVEIVEVAETPTSKQIAIPSTVLENPQYVTYTDTLYESLLGKQPMVIYFHADWCTVCAGLDKNLKADIESFPKGTKILKADFDTAYELRYKYNITFQSTFVIVDSEGSHVATLAIPNNDELKEAIKATLT